MRYFLISYAYPEGFGSFGYESPEMPSRFEITRMAASDVNRQLKDIVILFIYEFKNKEDFKKFFKGASPL